MDVFSLICKPRNVSKVSSFFRWVLCTHHCAQQHLHIWVRVLMLFRSDDDFERSKRKFPLPQPPLAHDEIADGDVVTRFALPRRGDFSYYDLDTII